MNGMGRPPSPPLLVPLASSYRALLPTALYFPPRSTTALYFLPRSFPPRSTSYRAPLPTALHFPPRSTSYRAPFATALVGTQVLKTDENLRLLDGVPVDEWEDEGGEMRQEAADGGTTATVIALLDGATLVHAQVGDSSALLGGTIVNEDGEAEVLFASSP